jgi:dTDP-glucose 4,6-dehydratase
VINFAAESHVDRSISGPAEFIQTNIVGTFNLLESVRAYWQDLLQPEKQLFVFCMFLPMKFMARCHRQMRPFAESNAYEPNSPYAASKAASDHLVRAWHHTYGLPVLTTNCSNNYGCYHFPEKLIPLSYFKCLSRQAFAYLW